MSAPNTFFKRVRKALCSLLSASLLVTSTLPARVSAQAVTCDPYQAVSGADIRCQGARIGGMAYAAPKLQWELLGDLPVMPTQGTNRIYGGSEAVNLGNKAASVLGMQPEQVASMVAAFPSNVPYVFARYNHMDNQLRIDVFKIEKTMGTNPPRAGLYHATFGPGHGDAWKLNRSYISPDAFTGGMTPGVNPFAQFATPGSDIFQNISLEGAQVAVGHAMRLLGAPLALMSMANVRLDSTTTKSSGLFTKKTTVTVWGYAKPRWFIAMPHQMLNRSTTTMDASFCATNPGTTDCPRYATAASGVAFEEFDGGTLSDFEDKWMIDQKSKTGLSFLGALILAVVGSFAMVGLLGAAGLGAGAAGGAATAGSSVALGGWGSIMATQGVVFTQIGAIAFETAVTAAGMALAGANLSSTINFSPGVLLGVVSVSKGFGTAPGLSEYQEKLNQRLHPLMTSDFSKGPGQSLTGFDQTVQGSCAPGVLATNCHAQAGMIQRADQYVESNEVQFVRDNDGRIMRTDTANFPR